MKFEMKALSIMLGNLGLKGKRGFEGYVIFVHFPK